MNINIPWINLQKKWKLIDFKQSTPPSWEEYLTKQREYWGQDRISGINSLNWPWKGSEEKWLEITKKDYQSYVIYCSKWFGKFEKGSIIPIIRANEKNVIKLSVIKDGKTTWHDTLELWLFLDISIIPPKKELKCKIYTFSTLVDKYNEPLTSRVDGIFKVKNLGDKIIIGNAIFSQINE